MLVLFYETLE